MLKIRLFPATLISLIAALTGFLIGSITILNKGLPEVTALEDFRPPASTLILAADNTVLAEFATENRTPVNIERMPPELVNAFLAIEDHRYFEHIGINFGRIAKALIKDIMAGRMKEGGSTITQQLAKVLFLSPEKTVKRKMKEALLALQIEKLYTKEEILGFYLNQIYFGNGAYGVGAAAKIYFSKELDELSLEERALLAALPKGPSYYNPFRHTERARARRNIVIDRLVTLGWENAQDGAIAKESSMPEARGDLGRTSAPYFVEAVRKQVLEALGEELLYRGGLRVYTTLNPKLQNAAEAALQKGLAAIEMRNRNRGDDPIQIGLIAMDNLTGAIKAHIGGRDFDESQFDRALQANRQSGSTFKPIIYLAGLENGKTQATTVVDAPGEFTGSHPDKPWIPNNYDKEFKGRMTYRKALSLSRNLTAVRVLEEVGLSKVSATAHRLGLGRVVAPGLATALGVGSSTLLEQVRAYSVFPQGGYLPEPHMIRAVYGPEGKNLWDRPSLPKRVISQSTANVMADMLKGVVETGTGKLARALPFSVGGKTGTTDESRDASFVGFSSALSLGVWVGRDDNTPIGPRETGARAALPIWVDVMLASADKSIPVPWKMGSDITFVKIDLNSGKTAGPECDETGYAAFVKGTEPTLPCDYEEFDWDHLSSKVGFGLEHRGIQ